MTDKEIYLKFAAKNDWGDSDSIELTAKQLEKIILTACKYARNDGRADGFEEGKRIATNFHKASGGSDIFNQMFGGVKK
jgi:hypothetical protein